jgi:hypothetical protein
MKLYVKFIEKDSTIVFKLHFEVYDKINSGFLFGVPEMKGFPVKYFSWIKQIVQIGPYFRTGKGLRMGDPLSPILFNIAIDV